MIIRSIFVNFQQIRIEQWVKLFFCSIRVGGTLLKTTPPPADRYISEDFKRQMTASMGTSDNLTQGAGITLSSPAIGSAPIKYEGFTNGAALSDDFKLWLSRHPDHTIEEALHRYREEQKAKQRRKGPRLH